MAICWRRDGIKCDVGLEHIQYCLFCHISDEHWNQIDDFLIPRGQEMESRWGRWFQIHPKIFKWQLDSKRKKKTNKSTWSILHIFYYSHSIFFLFVFLLYILECSDFSVKCVIIAIMFQFPRVLCLLLLFIS